MAGLIFIYALAFAAAAGAGFVLGAAAHRAIVGAQLLDMDGDVQSLRVLLTEAKGLQDGA